MNEKEEWRGTIADGRKLTKQEYIDLLLNDLKAHREKTESETKGDIDTSRLLITIIQQYIGYFNDDRQFLEWINSLITTIRLINLNQLNLKEATK